MRLSELLQNYSDDDFISIVKENEFDRFSRTTSLTSGTCCVYVARREFIGTIPTNATMVITTPELVEFIDVGKYGVCLSKNPKSSYFRAFCYSSKVNSTEKRATSISKSAKVSETAIIGDYNIHIGENVIIEDNAIIHENVIIGDDCIIRAGANIGIQDYNYYFDNGKNIHLPHFGKVIISDNVEIGYNSLVGQALYPGDVTYIGSNVKVGFFSIIGHDSRIDQNTMIYDRVIVGGYTEVGENTRITLSSTIKNGLKVGRDVVVDMGSVVIRNIPDGETVFGNPARRVVIPK